MKSLSILLLAPLWATASPVLISSLNHDAAPLLTSSNAEQVPDSYMVVFKKDISHADACSHHEWVQDLHLQIETLKTKKRDLTQLALAAFGGLKHTYHIPGLMAGYSGHFDEEVIESVRRHPHVSLHRLDNEAA